MLSDITLGQYFPGNSIIHRFDARFKIIAIVLFIVGIFSANSLAAYAGVVLQTVLIVALSRLNVKMIVKSLKPILFILAFTVAANLLLTKGEKPLVDIGFVEIYPEGILYAFLMALRIVCLIVGTFVLLTYTTTPVSLTDAIERLLSPFAKIGLPVHEFSMMMTIALRFIPTLIEETDKIMSAQKARGADFESGSLVRRAKALVPILIPLFISAFRRADDLATAMECRCYRGGNGRTRMTKLKLHFRDFAALFVIAAFIAGAVLLNLVPTWISM